MAGLYFEQFEVGQTLQHDIRRTVTETDNLLFSTMTHNPAAIHIDAEYAKTTEFGRPLMNSAFTLGLMVGISAGAALDATLQVARTLDHGVVVTVFPDGAEKYLTETFWTAE